MEPERLSVEDINKLKVLDLKKKLQSRGLSINGNKSELKERLLKFYQSIDEAIDVTLDEAAGLIDDVDAADDLLNDSPTKLDDSGTVGVESEIAGAAAAAAAAAVESRPQKIKLKRTLDDLEDDDDDDVEECEEQNNTNGTENGVGSEVVAVTEVTIAPVMTATTAEPKQNQPPLKVIKLADISKLTEAERMEMRIKKFGAISDDAKKMMRAKKFGIECSSSSVLQQSNLSSSVSSTSIPNLELLKKRAERFGEVCSPALLKLKEQEKLEERKKRFAANTPIPATELNRKISLLK